MTQVIGRTIAEIRSGAEPDGVEIVFTDGTCFHLVPKVILSVEFKTFNQDGELTAEESRAL